MIKYTSRKINRYALVMKERTPAILGQIEDELRVARNFLDGVRKDGCETDVYLLKVTAQKVYDLAIELEVMALIESRAEDYEEEVVSYPPVDLRGPGL